MRYLAYAKMYIKEHVYYFTILFTLAIILFFGGYYKLQYVNILEDGESKLLYQQYNINFEKVDKNIYRYKIGYLQDFLDLVNTNLDLEYSEQLINNIASLSIKDILEHIVYQVEIEDFILKKYLTIKPVAFDETLHNTLLEDLIKNEKLVIFIELGFTNSILNIDIANFNGYMKKDDSNRVLSSYLKGFHLTNSGGEYTLNIDSFGIIDSNYPEFNETEKSIIKKMKLVFDDEEIYQLCIKEANIRGYLEMFQFKNLYLGECDNEAINSIKYFEYSAYKALPRKVQTKKVEILNDANETIVVEVEETPPPLPTINSQVIFGSLEEMGTTLKEIEQNEINLKFDNYYGDRKLLNSFKLSNVNIDTFDSLYINEVTTLNNIHVLNALLLKEGVLNEQEQTLGTFTIDVTNFEFDFQFPYSEFILK